MLAARGATSTPGTVYCGAPGSGPSLYFDGR